MLRNLAQGTSVNSDFITKEACLRGSVNSKEVPLLHFEFQPNEIYPYATNQNA